MTDQLATVLAGVTPWATLAAPGAEGEVGRAGAVPGASLTLLVPVLTILATVLCGLCAVFKVRSKLPAWISVACLAGSFLAIVGTYLDVTAGGGGVAGGARLAHGFDWLVFRWSDGPVGAGGMFVANFSFYIDGLTLLWMLFVTGLATAIALYASEYMSHEAGPGYCRFFAAFNLFVFSMACLVMADNLVLLYLGWEGVGLCSYLLIGYFYKKPSAVAAAKKAFIVNRIGDLGLALGIMLCFVQFGTVEYDQLWRKIEPFYEAARAGAWDQIPLSVQAIALLLMVGCFGKSAQLPLYVWLPDAMEGPTPVSALIHAATMVTAGVYLVARMLPVFALSEHALEIVAWVGTLTALFSATIGMAQFDIKRIMAYSTVSQLGYMFAGLGVMTAASGSADAASGGPFHVFTHAFFKALLFLCCGAVMHGFAGQLDLRRLSGVMGMPGWRIVGVGMLVGCLNLAGFPFTAGFFSKDMILAEAFTNPATQAIGWLLLLTAGLTAYYTFRVFFRVFVGPPQYELGDEHHGTDHGADHGQGHGHDAHGGHGHEHGHAGHGHEHGEGAEHAHGPHAPGWAINTVLAGLTIGALAAAAAYVFKWVPGLLEDSSAVLAFGHGGGHGAGHGSGDGAGAAHAEHGKFLGMDPHAVMYYVSAVVGGAGILVAAYLHGPRGLGGLMLGAREGSATSRADGLKPRLGPVGRWAEGKWYVDEIYEGLIRLPLWVLSTVFYTIDKLLVDGIVNAFGYAPRGAGWAIRPGQHGVLNGYAAGMAAGLALLALLAMMVMR